MGRLPCSSCAPPPYLWDACTHLISQMHRPAAEVESCFCRQHMGLLGGSGQGPMLIEMLVTSPINFGPINHDKPPSCCSDAMDPNQAKIRHSRP